MAASLALWTTSSLPSTISTRSIDPSKTSDLMETLTSATARIATETVKGNLISLSRAIRGAEASLDIISAEKVLATATDSSASSQATHEIFVASVNLEDLFWEYSFYEFRLSRTGNIFFMALFGFLFIYYTLMPIISRYHWFNVTFWCGYALEFAGFLGRILSFIDATNVNYFLLQFVSLTIAPAFIMAGIYFTFAQLVVVYGRHYSLLKPLWYTYIFITFDVLSLVIQAIGGGMASVASSNNEDPSPGTNVMIAGIAFQVFSMSVFLTLWFLFLWRVFKSRKVTDTNPPSKILGLLNFFKMLVNTRAANQYKTLELEEFYNERFADVRSHGKLVNYYPLGITVASLAIYCRCVYRVVELAQGWSGFLITHEVYLMVLDASMVAICGIVFVLFHPHFVFGENTKLKVSDIRNNTDENSTEVATPEKETPSNYVGDSDRSTAQNFSPAQSIIADSTK